jgi:hypothetical protein
MIHVIVVRQSVRGLVTDQVNEYLLSIFRAARAS